MTELNAAIRDIPIPYRMRHLPVSETGFPIPWFVHIDDRGVADFRVIGRCKIHDAVKRRLCWLCGEPLGTWFCFTSGPMCVINRTSAEPPEHLDCAEYAVKACPFLSNPRMRRNDKDMIPETRNAPGVMIKRNPGAVAIYVTRSYKPFKAGIGGGVLFQMGEPERVQWYAEGRKATRDEVVASIESGLPLLEAEAEKDGKQAVDELFVWVRRAELLLPAF